MKIIRIIMLVILLPYYAVAQNQLKTENVILITLDGLRWQELFGGADSALVNSKEYTKEQEDIKSRFWDADPLVRRQKLMPFFWSTMAREGKLFGNRKYGNKANLSNTFWFSYPGYNEILTGYSDSLINSNDKVNNHNVTILEIANQQLKYKGKVAAFGSWDVFPYIINEERSKIPVNAGFESATGATLTEREKFLNELQKQVPSPWGSVRLDAFTHHFALEFMKKNQPKLIYIAYGETDDFAHDGRYDYYLKSARQTDGFIQELWEFVQSHDQYKNKTTFIITTDHGRGTLPLETWKHHGDKINGADQVWIAVIGPDTNPEGEIKKEGQLYSNQVASTIAHFLGINFAPKTKGITALSMFYDRKKHEQ